MKAVLLILLCSCSTVKQSPDMERETDYVFHENLSRQPSVCFFDDSTPTRKRICFQNWQSDGGVRFHDEKTPAELRRALEICVDSMIENGKRR